MTEILLRRPGPPTPVPFEGVQIDDPRLAEALSRRAALVCLHQGTIHGEGPVWSAAERRLYWSDVANRRLLAWHEDGRVTVAIDATQFMNGNAIDAEGRLVHCEHGRRCISRSGVGGAVPIVTQYGGRRLNSPNDVAVAADGAIWFTDPTFGLISPSQGSLADPELDHRSVYRFDGELRRMADFEQPNGLAFSPDGATLYVTDTARSLRSLGMAGETHEIIAFDVGQDVAQDAGQGVGLSNRRRFHQTNHGVPDGLCVDARGWVWTTAGDGVHILAPDGRPMGYLATPATGSNCCFGERRLFITTGPQLLAIDLLV